MVFQFLRVAAIAFPLVTPAAVSQSNPAAGKNTAGNEACTRCHAEINNSYQKTIMAGASGTAGDGLITGQFDDKDSGVRYRVYQQDGRVWMSYERGGRDPIRGQRELLYFIGSGKKGRTYVFSDDQFLFETPINWYSQERRWNMTPAYTQAQEIPMNLPAFTSCLNCHTSGMQSPEAGSDSKFAGKPFLHAGITCQRCHGVGDEHKGGKGTMINPAKLPAERRDAICMECHFEGTVAVEQPGKHIYDFQPGEQLSDYVHYFVMTETQRQKPQALSQFQALSLSQCKRQSGDKLWCGSCHDSHSEPAPAEKAAYYRGKCLACHGEAFAARHHPDKADCRPCHMPALPSKDVAHTEATDHRILRFPNAAPLPQLQIRGKLLAAFPDSEASLATPRDYGLAWETLAERGFDGAPQRGENYLRQALQQNPDDAVVLDALGFLEMQRGYASEARDFYEQALKIDPLSNDAATNLGILEARAGNLRRAVELWNPAFARVPNRSAIGMDLAITFCAAGQKDIARKYVERVLKFNPDYHKAKSLLANLGKDPVECRP